jgi:hypothetical protein
VVTCRLLSLAQAMVSVSGHAAVPARVAAPPPSDAAARLTESAPAATPPASHHALYAELFGAGGLYSINYEYHTRLVALRAGFSWWEFCLFGSCDEVVGVPISITALAGSGDEQLEVGAGVTWLAEHLFVVPELGYRAMSREGGFLFRVTLTPMFGRNDGAWKILPVIGISLGCAW